MKVSDNATTPLFPMSSSLLFKTNKPMKPFKFNRRLNNRMASLAKGSPPITIPIHNYQIIPLSSVWTNTSLTPLNHMVSPINPNPNPINILSPPVITSSLMNPQRQNVPIYPSFKSFTTPRVTTTLIPLNVCHTEHCQTTKPSINIIENYQEQNTLKSKSKSSTITHLIGDWIIRESSEPFQQSSPIEQLTTKEKKVISNESITSCQSSLPNVNQWTVDGVCSFFECVLGKNCYTSIIKEHLIDGAALVLLQDEHLNSIFKMQLGPRLKLLDRINKLKDSDLSAS